MFEYLMRCWSLPNYENTLLDETCKGAVRSKSSTAICAASLGCVRIRLQPHDVHLNYQYAPLACPVWV